MKQIEYVGTQIIKKRILASSDGLKIDRKPGGQPLFKSNARLSPGDKFQVCDEQAALELAKRPHGAIEFKLVDEPSAKSKPRKDGE
jgi:hypothetical protein